jgi:Fe2+ or Zn2+ uptake regulation protein
MLKENQTIESVREHGHRLTPQRRLVLEIVTASQDHLDAESIYLQAKQRDDRISLATVYRSLALLKEIGLIVEHSLGEDHAHFESAQASPHYHFTCERCGRVVEFSAPEIENILKNLCVEKKLEVNEVHFFITGVCQICQQQN